MRIADIKKPLIGWPTKKGGAMLGEHETIMTVAEGIRYLTALRNKGGDDEPIFILRGQDKLAVPTVFFWAQIAEKHGVSLKKVSGAWAHAEAMAGWSPRKLPD